MIKEKNYIKINNKKQLILTNFDSIPINKYWDSDINKELLMHKIHIYPAKFPAFIAQKAFDYAKTKKMKLNLVCDVFCGCGTVALEARRHKINFLGFDINPIAAIISKAKGENYEILEVERLYELIINNFNDCNNHENNFEFANPRLKYWFFADQYNDLFILKNSINTIIKCDKYNNLFKCIFSNSLKACSKWLTKSIKPQVDPNKKCARVIEEFNKNYRKVLKALKELENYDTKVIVENKNILENENYLGTVDFIITSPPYVTSYEYADLHQLSSLWLEYTNDFTRLRKNSIGSLHNLANYHINKDFLNDTAKEIVQELQIKNKTKAKSVARYYEDMQKTILKCKDLLVTNGRILLVIGDTEYKKIKMQNAKFICEELINNNFYIEMICKRNITNKYLTPYRSEDGKFSSNKSDKQIYSKEYIIIGRKR